MNLVSNPHRNLGEYIRKVNEDSFRRGDFEVYFDVFEDGDKLFSSYNHNQTLAEWNARNPVAAEDPRANPWTRGQQALAKWPIPRKDTYAPRTLSLTEVALILQENFNLALNGRPAGLSVIKPTANNLRQLLHYHDTPWAVRWMVDNTNGITVRALICHKAADETFDTARDLDAG